MPARQLQVLLNDLDCALDLPRRDRFDQIPMVIEDVVERHVPMPNPSLEEVCEADAWARDVGRRAALAVSR